VEAATRAVGLKLSQEDLQVLSGRGGASGVGVNSYFLGGLVGDSGRAGSSAAFRPSSASASLAVPKVLYRVDWPSQWQVAVMRLKNAVGISGNDEVEFFRRETPFPRAEAALAALALSFELPGCVMDRDFDGLRDCLSEIRGCGFKSREMLLQPLSMDLISALEDNRLLAVAMSSFGPSVVVIGREGTNVAEILANVEGEWAVIDGGVCSSGRVIYES
jgi:beta-ribofuranosylaminobenzene 5'-phosphate synthase